MVRSANILVLIFLLIGIASFCDAQKITTFQRSYGGPKDDFGTSVVNLPNGDFIIAGTSNGYSAGGDDDILIIRTDSLGKIRWSKTYGGNAEEGDVPIFLSRDLDIILTPDTNIVVCSNTKSYGAGGSDVYFFKIDLNGNVKWAHTYGGQADDFGAGLMIDPNGGYLIVGQTKSYGAGNGDVLLIKTDTSGKIIWSKAYGSQTNEEQGFFISGTHSGNIMIEGTALTASFSYDQMVMCVDKSGKLLWSKIYGAPGYGEAFSSVELPDKTIYLMGNSYNSFNGANTVATLSKLDSAGNLIWSKIYDKDSHSGIGIAMYDKTKNIFNISMSVYQDNAQRMGYMRIDTSGKIKSIKTFGSFSSTSVIKNYSAGYGHNFLQVSSGEFVLIETSQVFGFGGWDYYFLKLDSSDNPLACNVSTVKLLPFDYTSYMANHSYPFTSSNISLSVSTGMSVKTVPINDSLLCAPFVARFSWQNTCVGQAVPFFDSSYYKPTSWQWDFGDAASANNISTSQNPSHVFSSDGIYKVKLVAGNGIRKDSVIQTVIVQNHKQLKTASYLVCKGDSVNLSVPGVLGKTYAWSPGSVIKDSTSPSVWIHPTQNSVFTVNITYSTGCSVSDSIIINIDHIPPISIGGDKTSCNGSVTLTPLAYPGVKYLWSTGDTNSTISVSVSGKYWLRVNKKACTASDTAIINISKPAAFSNDNLHNYLFCSDDSSLTLDAGPAYKYLWSPGGDTTRKIKVSASGIFTIQISNTEGCTANKSIVVTDQCKTILFIPNVFSPNKDSLNDQFKPISRWPLENYDFQVYNRWGEKIFQSKDINLGWDGKFMEVPCPEGVYLYMIDYKFPYNIEQMRSGTVTLIRK